MAAPTPTLSGLPGEILLQILSFLEAPDITNLQQVSRKLRDVGRDDMFWRSRCLAGSAFLEAFKRRQLRLLDSSLGSRAGAASDSSGGDLEPLQLAAIQVAASSAPTTSATGQKEDTFRNREKARIMANWDPSYPYEKVSWYSEYIQRHASISISWFQQPRFNDTSASEALPVETKGVSLYRPDNPGEQPGVLESLFAVSPLDDGSVCLWDVNGSKGRQGAVYARSSPGILFIDGPGADNRRRSKRVDSGMTECVSVDSHRHRAFFAVQSHLLEVDLETLSVIGCESFPWSITTLSTASPGLPLTVGTSNGIHLYDPRVTAPVLQVENGAADTIDGFDRSGASRDFYERSLKALFDQEPLPPYASLSQPTPLSILHLQRPGAPEDILDDIYVAGRFSNILHYDRRKFPTIKGSIHSGARLCSMASLPFSFSALDSELRRKGQLTLAQLEKSKSAQGGRTIVACGEYNTKGSLELYGLTPPDLASPGVPGGLQSSTLKNRQTCSQSKLLYVANHGTKLVFSDGSGMLKWFERDGFTEVRRCRIGHWEGESTPSLFSSMPGSDDIARKLLPTQSRNSNNEASPSKPGSTRLDSHDILFWTGEKLGLVGFSSRPGFTPEDFEDRAKSEHDAGLEREEREYGDRMRAALQRQAEDARFVQGLGLGSGLRG